MLHGRSARCCLWLVFTISMHRNPAGTHRLGVVSDRMDELEGYNASFGRDAALVLRQVAEELP